METKKMVIVLLGTRPEAIKMAPLILELKKHSSSYKLCIVSTGQHREMMAPILDFFNIKPDLDLNLMRPGQSLSNVVSKVIEGLEGNFNQMKIDGIFVQGDTASCMAASVWGFLSKVPVFHVEAGLRTGNMSSPWPEEFNRRVTALATSLHFSPTEASAQNLYQEGFAKENIFVVGNTVIDALNLVVKGLRENSDLKREMSERFPQLDFKKKLILTTVHRRESFGDGLKNIFRALVKLSERDDVQVILPLHLNPNVQAAAEILKGSKVLIVEPQSYVPFVFLMNQATLILSDSGGVQEEAPFLGKTVLVLRESTERPESISSGFCHLVGTKMEDIFSASNDFLEGKFKFPVPTNAVSPYGNGDSSRQILDIVNKFFTNL